MPRGRGGNEKEHGAMPDDPTTTPAPNTITPAAPAPAAVPAPAAPASSSATPEPTTPPKPDEGDEPLREPGKKALDEERKARSKAEADLAALRKQIEDANKTAEQRAADDLKAAQTVAATAEARALRYEIAAEHDIPLHLAPRLTGTTREEIAADAAVFKSQIPAGATPVPRPAPDPGQGARPDDAKSDDDKTYEALYGAPTKK